jgi:tetratricopeptide (TPR) repeat protein
MREVDYVTLGEIAEILLEEGYYELAIEKALEGL